MPFAGPRRLLKGKAKDRRDDAEPTADPAPYPSQSPPPPPTLRAAFARKALNSNARHGGRADGALVFGSLAKSLLPCRFSSSLHVRVGRRQVERAARERCNRLREVSEVVLGHEEWWGWSGWVGGCKRWVRVARAGLARVRADRMGGECLCYLLAVRSALLCSRRASLACDWNRPREEVSRTTKLVRCALCA